jgi:hypothetical protein
MAGAGYKLFQTGDVLTAAQVNTYLNEQTVMVFASSAARTSALSGVLAEGMVSYLQDTNAVEVYNGTAWVGVSGAGDVTEVQAGVGISVASGTGPIPIVTNSSTDLITTAGDLLYGTAADTVARLGIGTASQVLAVNSGATAPEWVTPASGGGMTSIAAANLPAANTVTLSSISGSYVDLVLYVRDFYFAADDYLCLRVNGATGGTDYGWININQSAENTAAVGADGLRDRLFFTGDDGNESADRNAFALCQFPDYANASHIKALYLRSVVRDQTNTYNTQAMQFANYNSASAISSITLFTQNGNNFSGGSYVLYGVK